MSVYIQQNFITTRVSNNLTPQHTSGQETASLAEALDKYKDLPPIPFVIPGIKEVSFGFVFGPSKSGKTIYCENLLQSIAAGRTVFNGYPLQCSNRKSLFISYEENERGRFDRNTRQLQSFTLEEQEQIRKRYFVSTEDMPKYILDDKGWNILEERIIYHKPGVVVIDSLSRLTMENNSDEDTGKKVSKKLRELVFNHQCTIIVINHTTKGNNDAPLTITSMSGSRIYLQEADFMIGINRSVKNTRYIKMVCARYGKDDYETVDTFEIAPDDLCIKLKEKAYEAKILAGADGRHDNQNYDTVLQEIAVLTAGSENKEFDSKDLISLYEGQEKVMSKDTLFSVLRKLGKDNRIKKLVRGKYTFLV